MSRSNFSRSGLNIGENSTNMTYLYGISDFFSVMFEDTTKVNLLLEAEAEVASSAYSNFLQLTSHISLQDIQATTGKILKLITLKSSDAVVGQVNCYKLPSKIVDTRYIANRPLLPTTLLEQGVDYRIEKVGEGFQVRFAKSITDAGFSTRLLSDEVTKEFALWFVDTEIDEGWISNNYAALIGVDPQTSTEAFKNFIQGLYYIYLNGPTLELLGKGLNLCLGVPLARDIETVIDVRKYLETDQYIVVTDLNQYLVPYGLVPKVQADDILNVGDALAQWVEIKDYINDGEWWINLKIPAKLIPGLPAGQPDRYATRGSHYDYLMRTYLRKHTFLVNVKVAEFKNNQVFQQISDIIRKAKPAYTESIYIWTVPNEETLSSNDDVFFQRRDILRHENINPGIEQFFRGNSVTPASRSDPLFIRYNVPHYVTKLCGTDTYCNGDSIGFDGSIATGFVNPNFQFRDNTDAEKGWLRAVRSRGTETVTTLRDKIGFFRGSSIPEDGTGLTAHDMHNRLKLSPNMRIVPLYTTTQADLESKCKTAGIYVPQLSEWWFDLFNPLDDSESVDNLDTDDGRTFYTPSRFKQNFDLFITRSANVNYLSSIIPDEGWKMVTVSLADIDEADYLVGIRIHDNIVGIYLVTANNPVSDHMYSVVYETDTMTMTMTTAPNRGLGLTSSSFYLSRGARNLDYNIAIADTTFTDSINTTPVPKNRGGGILLKHMMELK